EEGLFYGCERLSSVTFPVGLTSIGESAFFRCQNLNEISLPIGLTSIGDLAFSGCISLADVELPLGLTSVGDRAFSKCENLRRIKIPVSVTAIGEWAFEGSDDLRIYGYTYSYAEEYANVYSIPFFSLGEAFILPMPGSGCMIDLENGLIWGLATGLRVEELMTDFLRLMPGFEFQFKGKGVGTGLILDIIDPSAAHGSGVVASFTIVIFGDLNGDGAIDSNDSGVLTDYENFLITWDEDDDAAFLMAADVNGDGVLDSGDAGLLTDCENFLVNVNQVTGLAA
ncbi:MAG TPA: leucine-rich repeat protein, partial [Oscillospiraceae bacterium]|nr:leucine-rich repeat protein [Oscillospiraceae bacterium]